MIEMKIDPSSLKHLNDLMEVRPGNIYPAKGGRKPSTDFWLVVATAGEVCYMIGFDGEGNPRSTSTYYKSALQTRPIIGYCDVSNWVIKSSQ